MTGKTWWVIVTAFFGVLVRAHAQPYDVRVLSPAGQAAFEEGAVRVSSDAASFAAFLKGDTVDPAHAWHAYRAGRSMSEEEFFTLVRDPEKAAEARAHLRNRSGQKTAGFIIGALGFTGMITSIVVLFSEQEGTNSGITITLISTPIAVTGEMLFLLAGPPNRYTKDEALEAAERYNRGLFEELEKRESEAGVSGPEP
jgi:hypothetical protein